MTRVEQINGAVDALKEAEQVWVKDPQSGPIPSPSLCNAITGLWKVMEAGPCPPSHVALNNAASVLKRRYDEWDSQEEVDTSVTDGRGGYGPRPRMWEAMSNVFDLRRRLVISPPAPLATIETLRKNGSSDDQIARYTYGFRTTDGVTHDENGTRYAGPLLLPNGQIDVMKFEQEAAQPRSVVPIDWVHPRVKANLTAAGYYDQSPAVNIGPKVKTVEERTEQARLMLTTGGLLQQTASCTGFSIEDLTEMCDREGIPLPLLNPAAVETPKDDLETAIVELAAKGTQDHKIVEELRKRGMSGVNLGKVKQVKLRMTPATAAN